MKKELFVLSSLLLFSCNQESKNSNLKKAEVYMKGAMAAENAWQEKFEKEGYAIFLNQKYPSPFDSIIVVDSSKINEIQGFISKITTGYGKIVDRKFMGIHIVLEGKLYSYVPDRMKAFKKMNPKKLGFKNIGQMYIKGVPGTYAYVMNRLGTEKKTKAEELVVLWLNKDSSWSFVTYRIDDEI